jgi:site-specific DNA-methyltransferase (adenine-specific)
MSHDGLVALSSQCARWKGRSLCPQNALDLPHISNLTAPNRLYFGDNLNVLRTRIADASVDLCYIDPPFNSKRNYNQIYSKVGAEDRAQAQAFIDTWIWDSIAEQGWGEILDNEKGRFTSQTIEFI